MTTAACAVRGYTDVRGRSAFCSNAFLRSVRLKRNPDEPLVVEEHPLCLTRPLGPDTRVLAISRCVLRSSVWELHGLVSNPACFGNDFGNRALGRKKTMDFQ
jgi:hypothetical protein